MASTSDPFDAERARYATGDLAGKCATSVTMARMAAPAVIARGLSHYSSALDLAAPDGGKLSTMRAAFEDKEEGGVVKGTRPETMDDDSDWAVFWSGGGDWGEDQGGGGLVGAAEAALVTVGPEGSEADIWIKPSADISNLSAEMKATFAKIVAAFKALGLPHPVITSGNDSQHGAGSLHYQNQAIDLRGNNITDEQGLALQDQLRTALGSNYDVIFERFPDPSNDHLHIEFDPD